MSELTDQRVSLNCRFAINARLLRQIPHEHLNTRPSLRCGEGVTWLSMIRTLVFALLVALTATVSAAATSDTYTSERLSARLIAAQDSIAPDTTTVSAALVVDLVGNWHAYWRSPGEVGLPPEIDWSRSENLSDAAFAYPAPTRFRAFGTGAKRLRRYSIRGVRVPWTNRRSTAG